MKLCKDCKHFSKAAEPGGILQLFPKEFLHPEYFDKCRHPENTDVKPDYVHGNPPVIKYRQTPKDLRGNRLFCGPDGEWFKTTY